MYGRWAGAPLSVGIISRILYLFSPLQTRRHPRSCKVEMRCQVWIEVNIVRREMLAAVVIVSDDLRSDALGGEFTRNG